jgi:hypothetical protein
MVTPFRQCDYDAAKKDMVKRLGKKPETFSSRAK